jgi:hypothetical protein
MGCPRPGDSLGHSAADMCSAACRVQDSMLCAGDPFAALPAHCLAGRALTCIQPQPYLVHSIRRLAMCFDGLLLKWWPARATPQTSFVQWCLTACFICGRTGKAKSHESFPCMHGRHLSMQQGLRMVLSCAHAPRCAATTYAPACNSIDRDVLDIAWPQPLVSYACPPHNVQVLGRTALYIFPQPRLLQADHTHSIRTAYSPAGGLAVC